ncbi:MAG: DNA polymerase III subunit gamma/tau [Armatimonadetes bacterium]|nr:DNA polymerase III subunit gamma/tau [Armatimonadota bacterium]
MSHLALYRKYRSQTFQDLVGQDHVVRTLRHAIEQGKIAHAYLFTGPRGTGKTSTARLLAKALNCTGGPSFDLPPDCPICEEISQGRCIDVKEMDAASESGVDEVRAGIVNASEYEPAMCRYRIFIIDEVHDLSLKAFDALLKTIEEPPAHVIFILATTEYHKVPPTIRSRCQRFEFHRGSVSDLLGRLEYVAKSEGMDVEPAALAAIARLADGGYRDALTLLEQAAVTTDGKVTLQHVYDQLGLIEDDVTDQLLLAINESNFAQIIEGLEEIYRRGRDPQSVAESLMHRLADLTRAVVQPASQGKGDAAVEASLTATASRIGHERILALRGLIARSHRDLRDVTLPRLWLEAECVRVAQILNAPAATAAPVAPTRAAVASQPSPQVATKPAVDRISVSQPALETPRAAPVETSPQAGVKVGSFGGDASGGDDGLWRQVVKTLSDMSKIAAMRLPLSRVASHENGVLTIEFRRTADADWVTENIKIQQAIRTEWKKAAGKDAEFRFVGRGQAAPSAPTIEKASVESVLEGDELADAGKKILFDEDAKSGADSEPKEDDSV